MEYSVAVILITLMALIAAVQEIRLVQKVDVVHHNAIEILGDTKRFGIPDFILCILLVAVVVWLLV